jgi:glycosyltransferase involved in cell wall biosynthesis
MHDSNFLQMITVACIPAFNEEQNIASIIHSCAKHVDKVIVCNDGSTDNTESEAFSAGAYIINHSTNMGKGKSMKSLFELCKFINADIVITIDGDGQFLPAEIPKLTKDIEDGKSDIVIGYRFETETDMPSYRKIGNKILDELNKKASNLNLRDTQSGFRAYSKKAISIINFQNDGFVADSEILIDASTKGLIISEHNVTVLYNTGTRTSTQNPIVHGGSVLISLLEIILMKRPLTYLGIPGFIMLLIGISTSSFTLISFNETGYFSIPITLLSVALFTVGIILILVSGILFSFNRTFQSQNT